MTDNEIMKALDCCSNDDDGSGCGNCPLGDKYPYCDDVLDGQNGYKRCWLSIGYR